MLLSIPSLLQSFFYWAARFLGNGLSRDFSYFSFGPLARKQVECRPRPDANELFSVNCASTQLTTRLGPQKGLSPSQVFRLQVRSSFDCFTYHLAPPHSAAPAQLRIDTNPANVHVFF